MITFSNVSLIYPHSTKTVLEDLTCQIQEGEMVLVMGRQDLENLHSCALSMD